MHLSNFFYDCKCGHVLQFEDTEEVHKCPLCTRTVLLPTAFKTRLISQREQIKAKIHAQQLA